MATKKIVKPTAKKAAPKKNAKPTAKKIVAKKVEVKKAVAKASTKAPVKKAVVAKKAAPAKKAAVKAPAKAIAKKVAPKATASKKAVPAKKPIVKAVVKAVAKKAAAPAKKAVEVKKPIKKAVEVKLEEKEAPKSLSPKAKPRRRPAPKLVAPPVEEKKESAPKVLIKPPVRREIAPKPAPTTLKKGEVEKTFYSQSELEEFKDIINKKLAEAKKDFELLKESLSNKDNGTEDTSPTFKLLEDGSDVLSKEEVAQLASRQQKFITNLENALIRIENKTYGICRATGKLISKDRLRVVPHATLSIEGKMNQ